MGVSFGKYVKKKILPTKLLKNKIIVVDYLNIIFRYLATIRKSDGNYYTNEEGKCTSHIIGLINKFFLYLENGIIPIFVMDGISKEAKRETIEKRAKMREAYKEKLSEAISQQDEDMMQKYSRRIVQCNKHIVDTAIDIAKIFGFSIILAPGEGEAQASEICHQFNLFGIESTDKDILLFGNEKLITKIDNKQFEYISKEDILNENNLTNQQLLDMALLIGTDYNQGGVVGMGSARAFKFVQKENYILQLKTLIPDYENLYDLFAHPHLLTKEECEEQLLQKNSIKLGQLSKFLRQNSFSKEYCQNIIDRILYICPYLKS